MPPRKQSLQALRNQLSQVESSAQAKQAAIDAERVIEALAPTHTRRGCGDEQRDRDEDGHCARCCLLNAMDRRYVDFTWEFCVSCP